MNHQVRAPFRLTDAEKAQPLWQRLCIKWNDRIDVLHRELEQPTNTEAETALIRGQIKALRELLALNKELPPGSDPAR